MALKLAISKRMVEAIMDKWEADHPGKDAIKDMAPEEFSDLMMEAIYLTAEVIKDHPTKQ